MVKAYELKAKSILYRTKIPDADWAANYYSGCGHGCVYCYARFISRYRKKKEKWGKFVDVKINAPELLAKESKGKKGSIILCTCADPYQPLERKYQLTRKVLRALDPNLKLIILTKSDLITRDVDLFRRFKSCELGLTITTLDEKIRRVFEPFASSSQARVNALKKLKQEGFYTYCFIGPILPYLTDLEEVIRAVAPYADMLMFEDLDMAPAKKEIMSAIRKNFPELEEKYKRLSKSFWLDREKEIKKLAKKYRKPFRIYFKHTGSLKFNKK